MKKKKGFTLVELLAVIVILAVILIIAVPKISEVINNSKKASFEATAKTIANQAEKKYMENEVLGGSSTIKCSDVAKISDADYESCNITFDDKGNAKVTIVGKGKFDGMAVCNANKNSATISSDCSTNAKYFSYELQADGLTDDESKIYDVTVVDQSKCESYFISDDQGFTQEEATTTCTGGVIDGLTLTEAITNGYIPESVYETAGLKVDIYNKSVDVTVTDQGKCESYFISDDQGFTQEEATTLCNGGVINGETLVNYVKNDDIPASDYETAGLNVKDVYKWYDVTVSDQNKCVAYYKNLGETEEDATTFCNGGVINGDTLANDVKNGYIPKSDYETAGLKVTSKVYDKLGLSITGYNTEGGLDVIIPSMIDGKTVVAIADNAFTQGGVIPTLTAYNNDYRVSLLSYNSNNNYAVKPLAAGNESKGLGITSVIIPNTVIGIGKYAFGGNKLTNVTIPSSVVLIMDNAFKNNSNIVITNNSSIENIQDVWNKILGLDGVCSPEVTITNNIIEIGKRPHC